MPRLDINEMFEQWLKNPESLTPIDAAVAKAYLECVIDNPDASSYEATMKLTDQFEDLLNLVQFYKT